MTMKRLTLFLAAALLALAPMLADARPGGGGSIGSRGSRTYTAPPSTNTAPAPARPMERSMTEPARPSAPYGAPQQQYQPRGGGFFGGLMGGLVGAGLVGLLFGHGLFGGGIGFGGLLGMVVQLALLFFAVRFVLGLLARRGGMQPAYAGLGQPMMREASAPAYGGGGSVPPTQPVQATEADFATFERTLQAVNAAWSRQDLNALRGLATPEIVQYYADDLAQLASRGLRNETRDLKLEQGDLSEAWSEQGRDYATVAMRYSLLDATFRTSDNAVVEGSTSQRAMVTEVWTFVRARGGQWLISAVQQAG